MSDTAKVVVDGVEVEVPRNYSLLQACEEAGAEIPRFCYHERLSIAGNCRMCLVDWVGAPKPIASCAQAVGDMRPDRDGSPPKISTKSERAIKARNGVMEFLLINHPLDCPICDQGGECDLQDQAMGFGRAASRYQEPKRAVDDKYMGPLVSTVMTRCIQCTRCVRFAAEVAGVEEIGLISRGEDAQITTYLEASLESELSGNVIDLCPVGALTSKPYSFNARPWELRKTESIDVMDAMGAAIRVDARGSAVLRVMPRINEEINEEWISDKTRFAIDGLGRQRLDKPYIRKNGKLAPASWDEALEVVASKLKGDASKIAAIAGDLACVEGMKAALDLLRSIGVKSTDCRQDGAKLALDNEGNKLPRESYLFNSSIMGIDEADAVLIIGANPRKEAAVLNARIRKNWLHRDMPVALIGEAVDLSYEYTHLGNGSETLKGIKSGDGVFEALKAAKRPMIIVGQSALAREDGSAVLALASQLAADVGCFTAKTENEPAWNGFNVLHNAAARVGGLDLGFLPIDGGLDLAGILAGAQDGSIETIISLGADEIVGDSFGKTFVVYVGTHGDEGAHRADVILPSATYTEKSATYVNTEGRVQRTQRAVGLKGESREDWSIFRALSAKLDKPLPYDSLTALRADLNETLPVFKGMDYAPLTTEESVAPPYGKAGEVADASFAAAIGAFHLTNSIARASKTMAECAELAAQSVATAAE
ncbi:NADH-quinone oxidoreductase subunit NuoG [Hirschia baltica]|uniref:NADH-quinone oxidoreductase n=1 Tax=Hirschia baltica (strain ATCC 49814 / DSM 5838 / IFAM 1418) TaxID=582402 RepID=C6XJX7_HIRBI|nr:NADH-quinone oxidoreductase subunit NuoG [Hirschia baltica]ACT59422.1 NADH-quinone oxidoreductase, chain G [Hirschia baltica ATCC 49814]